MAATSAWVGLAAGALRLELAPRVGGSVARFGIERDAKVEPLLRPAPDGLDDVLDAGCFPLVPYSNRVRDGRFQFRGREVRLPPNMAGQRHPLHGDGWRRAWEVTERGPASAELLYRHEPADWPWAYEARQRFALDEDGLTVTLSCRNLSGEPMPCGLGQHPYFPCTGETVLDADAGWVWTIDEEVMPLERIPAEGRFGLGQRRICAQDLDNGFEDWAGTANIKWPERKLALTISSPQATRFQVYSPPEGGFFVAEPVTNANAALNRPEAEWEAAGLAILRPGEAASMTARFEARRL
ncbi:MAG TPA: aldose 1-epimerase [Caulobacteraceae bacterium]|jgi:aldose 1-epimerase